MSKARLKRYSTKILIALSKNDNDDFTNEMIRTILAERYENYSYKEIYAMYKKSENDINGLALGDALASCLIKKSQFIEEKVLDKLLPNLKLEALWSLSKVENLLIRKKSRRIIFDMIDSVDQKVINTIDSPKNLDNIISFEELKIKNNKRKILEFKKKEDKND